MEQRMNILTRGDETILASRRTDTKDGREGGHIVTVVSGRWKKLE